MTASNVIAFGFRHCAERGTRIIRDGDGITAAPSESNAEIDFSVRTGEVQGIIPEFDIDTARIADGAQLETTTFGVTGDHEEAVTGRLSMRRRGRWLCLTPDFGAVGATGYELVLFRAGRVVWRQPGLVGEAGSIGIASRVRARPCCRVLVYSASFFTATPFQVNDGPQVEADSAFFIPENRTVLPAAQTGLRLHATGMSEVRIPRLAVAVFDPFVMYSGTGDITVTPTADGLVVLAGQDTPGILDVDCGDVDDCALTLDLPRRSERREIAITGNLAGEPDQSVTFRLPSGLSGPSVVAVSGARGSGAGVRVELGASARMLVTAEQISAPPGAPDTLRRVQADLRALAERG